MTEQTPLDSILSGESAPAPSPDVEPKPTPDTPPADPKADGQPRAPNGQWASPKPKEEPAPAEPPIAAAPPVPPPTQPGTVPQGALHQAREKVREVAQAKDTEIAELKGQIAQLTAMFQQQPRIPPPAPQPPAPPPDRFSEPEAYDEWLKGQIVKPIEDRMASQNDFMSRRLAEMEHKPETVNAALMAMKAAYDSGEAHAEYQRIMASQHPYGELVTWHKNRTALTEIGNDPDAYRERVKAEIMAELQNGGQPPAPAGNPPPAQPVMPSNLASARNVGTRSGPTWGGPTALKDIFKR